MTTLDDPGTLAPDQPFWAIGDVHGRDDLLALVLDRVLPEGLPVVLVGDYINCGPGSAAVLDRLQRLTGTGQVIALRGNHEEMLLRFLARPRRGGRAFLRYGGQATFDSFGLAPQPPENLPLGFAQHRDAMIAAMPGLAAWLRRRPYAWHSGNVTVLHAGADPAQDIAVQPEITFAWGHPRFLDQPRHDGRWVVHGHAGVDRVTVAGGRIALDTRAHETGRLSAVRISRGRVDVLNP